MASGKKNYFRHSFSARNNVKIQSLIDKFGLAGYFYWFSLIELCAELSVDGIKTEYIYHQRTLIKELRLNKNRLSLVLTYMQSISLLSLTYNENKYALKIPNLSKYMGYYENKNEKKGPKESKGNEIKEKESKEASSFSFPPPGREPVEGCVEDVPDAFRQEFGKKLLELNWEKNHRYYFQNKIKKDYFEFQHESLSRTRDKFGDEKKDQDDVVNFLKEIEEENERYRANIKAKK
jgi:hypothetical protein